MTLSICIIAKNEELNLLGLFGSIHGVADEIVFVDTGSTDSTVAVAESVPRVKVYHKPWENDFSAARNESLDRATGDWILWLDADDRLPEDQRTNIAKLKNAPLDRAFAFMVVNSGKADSTGFMQVRMFPRRSYIRFERAIHEQITYSLERASIPIIPVPDVIIEHTGYVAQGLKEKKALRNREILFTELKKNQNDPDLLMHLGDTYFITAQYHIGVIHFADSYGLNKGNDKKADQAARAAWACAAGWYEMGNWSKVLEWALNALAAVPGHAPSLILVAQAADKMDLRGMEVMALRNLLHCGHGLVLYPEADVVSLKRHAEKRLKELGYAH